MAIAAAKASSFQLDSDRRQESAAAYRAKSIEDSEIGENLHAEAIEMEEKK